MKERPILFSAPMVRALLDGSKTQTRRVVKTEIVLGRDAFVAPRGKKTHGPAYFFPDTAELALKHCPYGQPGDRLWVRETFTKIIGQTAGWIETDYRATYTHGDRLGDTLGIKKKWTPAIHMPRDASRITLEIVSVRIERLGDISEADAKAEGITPKSNGKYHCDFLDGKVECLTPVTAYASLWSSIHGDDSWPENPWVWVIEFKKVVP